jgi:NADH-quinone oxidoreductase subunit G
VWQALGDPRKKVVAQVAPAVRVALGERFGLPPTPAVTGQLVAALKALGFEVVFDTCFAADLTVIEEANEFLDRKFGGEHLPLFTSCCPAWVKFAEQYYPELLPHLSTCRSPQAMLGSLAKETLPAELGVRREDVVMVSFMPCTAKKFEARRPELARDGVPDVDHVLTTQELARMIEEAGLRLGSLAPESFDLPMGFKTGAGVIFGSSGGVTEAVLRTAAERLSGERLRSVDFHQVRGEEGVRRANLAVGNHRLRLAVVSGLRNAKALAERVRLGASDFDLVEVMACPGGCIGGAGQPVAADPVEARRKRTKALFAADKELALHKSQENCYVAKTYADHLGEVGGHRAHELLHTSYQNRRRIADEDLGLTAATNQDPLRVTVCVGTSCFVKGSQAILKRLLREVEQRGLDGDVEVQASFCVEACDRGPSVRIGEERLERCTTDRAVEALDRALVRLGLPAARGGGEPGGCGSCGGCSGHHE